jgi:AraC-like DNA-binding protein
MGNVLSVGTTNRRLLQIEARTSDSPMVETVWRSQSRKEGTFLSIASSRWELIVSRHEGRIYCSVRGPETRPTVASCPPDGDWVGIHFKHGVFMPHLPVGELVDNSVDLPGAAGRSFWLHGAAWEFPTYDNAEAFIARLVKEELLVRDSVVPAMLQAQPVDLSPRSVQRRFLHATGLTHGAISQIERTQYAVALLRGGVSSLDTVERAGYADQPHLTRSLKRLIGLTPGQLSARADPVQLSYSPIITLGITPTA